MISRHDLFMLVSIIQMQGVWFHFSNVIFLTSVIIFHTVCAWSRDVTCLLESPCSGSSWNAPSHVYPHVFSRATTWSRVKWMFFLYANLSYMQYLSYFLEATLTFSCIRNLNRTVCFSPFLTPACLKRWVIWQRWCLVYWELASVSTDCYLCGGSPLWLH